jgi:ferredoxin
MWLENLGFCAEGDGWKLTEAGATSLIDGGDIPWNCSGGVLSSNPIGASGMLRFLETALQIRGLAGEHQVPDARRALGQAYGGGSQFFAMWVVGSTSPNGQVARPICSTVPSSQPTRRSSVKVVVDFDECASNAVCMGILPEVFEVRDDGYLYVLNEHPPGGAAREGCARPSTAAPPAPSP